MKKRYLCYGIGIIVCILLICYWFQNVKEAPAENHLNKIWISEPSDIIGSPFSFHINSVKGNIIAGNLQIGQPAVPDLLVYNEEPSKYLIPFSGDVEGNKAVCFFGKDPNESGVLTIYFFKDGTVEASIVWAHGEEMYKGVPSEKMYRFRPYHISDLEIDSSGKETSIEANLGFWNHVYLRAIQGNAPLLLITDNEGNVFYIFWDTVTGTEITQVTVEDINGDGLKDIKFLMEPPNNAGSDVEIWRTYYQRIDGLFVLCHECSTIRS